MANISAYFETISIILSYTYDTVLQLMKGHMSTLGKDKLFNQLFAVTKRAQGCVNWFKPNDEGADFLLSNK